MGQQNQTHLGDRRQYAPVLVAGMALALLLALAAPARAAAQDTNAYCFGHYGWLNGDDTWIYADIDDRPNGGRIWYRYWLSKSQTGPIPGLPRC